MIVTSRRHQRPDPEVFVLHGVDVTTRSIVGPKSSRHVRAGRRDIAIEIVTADSPGPTTVDVTVFEHVRAIGLHWPRHPTIIWQP